ncbi:anillin isoform X2 [Gouania willdenowi]|uniref:anillin isoform X2 n=1 Tax=Gouania willdenowi TaxID=441366 RepID=UPI001054156B|nr:anillin isoform X2 [Gouania willdenowi]
MDPFTEKLLERTRARRENLQKKMAERPNSATKQIVKRPREPLGETNSEIADSVSGKIPQLSTKSSTSKRKCSGENFQLAAGEENQEPNMARPVAPLLLDLPTDKKPPVEPSKAESLKASQQEGEKMMLTPALDPPSCNQTHIAAHGSALATNKEAQVKKPVSSAAGMKSRLQRLAEQRKGWDGTSNAAQECAPLQLLKRHEVSPGSILAVASEAPLGRKGRLANLAATIGSWEDDLSHANNPKEANKEKHSAVSTSTQPVKDKSVALGEQSAAVTNLDTCSKMKPSTHQELGNSSVSSTREVLPSPQMVSMSICKPSQLVANNDNSSIHGSAAATTPKKTVSNSSLHPPYSVRGVSQSPLKCRALSKEPNITSSPQNPQPRAKAILTDPSTSEQKAKVAVPGVKSFLERFEERCQERTNQCSPARDGTHAKMPAVTPSPTPNTRLVQERLRAVQATNTTTAELTQRQKLERESELAQIRERFHNGNNMWKNGGEKAQMKTDTDNKEEKQLSHLQMQKEELHETVGKEVSSKSQKEDTAASTERAQTPTKSNAAGHRKMMSPPTSTSCRAPTHNERMSEETVAVMGKELEVVTVTEMNVDQSINSAVINELFEGVLEQSEDQSEEEEDPLNISSMSLLTPLAETVAAVVTSPVKGMMTSTPANSFIVTNTPENSSKPNRFQRATVTRTSSVGVENSDDDQKLPYSIDAYRSTRLKETERPNVKQVIVRKEDVSCRAEEPKGSSHCSVRQKIKILSNEINLQQTVIHQASQALNCCTDEEHGKGSQVEAEAERLLLVATERREALKIELEQLKAAPAGHKKPSAALVAASKGSISLQELRLPLKADFVCSTANRPESTKHSFFIMIRAGAEDTVATPLASTHRGLSGDTLTFPTKFTLSDASCNFEIDLEVYCLVQRRDMNYDKKKKTTKSKAITPKRFLAITKSSQTPVVASPGGPNAVRTSNFVLVGSYKLSLSSIGKTKFALEKVPFLCPLEGHIFLKMQCEVGSKVEEKGFLTMFEDVSGFGAWHRRWSVLSGYCISYWTYPDDEKRKNPIGQINLANCTSRAVEPANREFCARPNTFELITARPQRKDDKETLVSHCKDTMCVSTNWLSADTKEERNLWMGKLNQILMDLRMWQPEACARP